ncbi:MAG TPA: hypothetical protein VGF82_26300 [Terracidiphilus sp.]
MKKLASALLGSVLMIPLITGCPAHRHVYVETYGPAETPYYGQWEHETHREHMEFERRQKAEQHEYWEWRKHHHDHD